MAVNSAFGAGINYLANSGKANANSLTMTSNTWNNEVGNSMLTPHSVLAPYAFNNYQSSNGSAGQNYLPGFGTIGTGNGLSSNTFNSNVQLRYVGGDANAELN